jgi:Zn-dependent peptidase ImmA (M78 family)/transcriptional regulator with XRE-family HTH domain
MPAVNPQILIWARETAGLTLAEAAEAFEIASEKRLAAFESGEEIPSRALLVKMTHKYRRSLLTFYLNAPPRKGDRGQDFRTVSPDRSMAADGLVDALLRGIKARQGLVRTTIQDDEDTSPLDFVGSLNVASGVTQVVKAIRTRLRTSLREYREQKTVADAFGLLRERAEEIGVFVLLVGDLGSHHTAIPVEVFRGFAIADEIAPFVVINDQDSRAAWSFTLLHELAHLWIGAGGISGNWADVTVEKFCNDVAGEFLLPKDELGELPRDHLASTSDAIAVISEFAAGRHLSRSMVAYRVYRAGWIGDARWRAVEGGLRELWQKEKAQRKEKARADETGPSYYIVQRHRLGRALLAFANQSVTSGSLSLVKAAKVLGVKPRSVFPLLVDPARAKRGPRPTGGA